MHKQLKTAVAALLLAMSALPMAAAVQKPDFNYPQTVSKNADADLNKALRSGDGEKAVDALVRYSIAQSMISRENMSRIVSRIDSVKRVERRPQFKSMLCYFEALVLMRYSDNGSLPVKEAEGGRPADYTEWTKNQFNAVADSLIMESVANESALKAHKLSEFGTIISNNTDDARLYCPTLLDFMLQCGSRLTASGTLRQKLLERRVAVNTKGSAPYMAASLECPYDALELYRDNKDSEYSALVLLNANINDNAKEYAALQEYALKFPGSRYINGIKNRIKKIETRNVTISYPCDLSPRDSVTVAVLLSNIKDFTLSVYRLPDGLKTQGWQVDKSKLKLVASTSHSSHGGTVPYDDSITVKLAPLPYGQYLITPSFDNDGQAVERTTLNKNDVLNIHTISLISVAADNGNTTLLATDINTGAPMKGVKVSCKGFSGTTAADGSLTLPKNLNYGLKATLGDDKYTPLYYASNYYSNSRTTNNRAELLTDLAIYRPGEKLKYTAVVYTQTQTSRTPLAGTKVTVGFYDNNNKQIDLDSTLTTDDYGRVTGEFAVPTDRMNGRFSLKMKYGQQDWCYAYVQVSEYKAPTYAVELTGMKTAYNKGLPVKISGKATSYTGTPIAGATVRMKLYRNQWSWWARSSNQGTLVADTTVTADNSGNFHVDYQASTFATTASSQGEVAPWRSLGYSYYIEATCTNAAGESQEASASFTIGHKRSVSLVGSTHDFIANKPIKLPVTYNSTADGDTHAQCTYKLTQANGKATVATGNFDSANPTVDFTNVPSGQYHIEIGILADTASEPSSATITIFRLTDKKAPVNNCQLWTSATANCVDDADVAHITIGTSVAESHIFYIASDRTGEVTRGWLKYKPGMHKLDIKIPAKENNEMQVQLISVYNRDIRKATFRFKTKACEHTLKLSSSSFRDRITPGNTEKWTFRLTDNKGRGVAGAMMLEVIDKAVNSIVPNQWQFSPTYGMSYRLGISNYNYQCQHSDNVSWCGKMLSYSGNWAVPELNTYGQTLFASVSDRAFGNLMLCNAMSMPAKKMAKANFSAANDAMAETEAADAASTKLSNISVREGQVKTALWRPMLVSDAQGNVSVEFEVPSQNGTWLMQSVAYDKSLASCTMQREIVAQKTIMVKPSAPRFVRQADNATLTATVQNAGQQSASVTAKAEIFDPRTGKVLAERTTERTIAPQGTDTVAITFAVTAEVPYVGFRIRATDGTHTDGEQCMIPVLASQSPVIETTPFFIDAAKSSFSLQLPDFKKDARLTLEYCDNPVWYCVTALPTIYSGGDSKIATSIAHDIFAAAVAQGTVKSNPELATAIRQWTEGGNADSTLTSMLERNTDLKTVTLMASPWINDAERQTLRMSRIADLTDEQKGTATISKLIDALANVQMGDGGFTWFRYPGCRSSITTTGMVLELIGETQQLGFLTGNSKLNSIVRRALQYYDYKMLEAFKEQTKRNPKNHNGFSGYAYVRSLFADVKPGNANAEMMQKVLKSLATEWKDASLTDKAYIAMTLSRNGNKAEAARVAESIRQFAMTKASTGLYWDNIGGSGWYRPNKVGTTAVILRALNEADPRTAEIDQVRKWLLLMKQSNDWGSSSLAADAVQALLSTGSNWTGKSSATVTIDSKTVETKQADQYLGYSRVSLDASAAGKTLAVSRSTAGPAWGAIYAQYQAPMTEVKAYKTDDIEATKQYLRYDAGDKLTPATTLKVGDKVQVRITVKLTKDASYITLTDERASCLEPADQTSGYRHGSGEWYYLETKDSQTNAFFCSLAKGTHVITYDAYVTAPGTYSTGIATVQCQYAPQITAHSAGATLTVTR